MCTNDLNLSTNEDIQLELSLEGSDPGDNPIIFSLVENPEFGILTGELPNLIYTPNENYFGIDTFTYQLFNGQYYSDVYIVTIDVLSQNDIPVLEIAAISLNEDESSTFDLLGFDSHEDLDYDDMFIALLRSNKSEVDVSGWM